MYLKISMKVTYLRYLGYPQQTISVTTPVQIPLSENTGKQRGVAYIRVSRHVSKKILKLHGIQFKVKMLVIEKAKTPSKAKSINGVNQNIFQQTQPPQL